MEKKGTWQIRQTGTADLPQVMELYQAARMFMKENGNPDQWGDEYPSKDLIEEDIKKGKSYVCQSGEDLLGVFYFSPREADPTYRTLLTGQWLNEEPYGVIHRLAVHTQGKGVAAFCVDWCIKQCDNLRIDTHKENRPMRRFLEKKGFVSCGTLRLPDGSLRMGFQKSKDLSDSPKGSLIKNAGDAGDDHGKPE